MADLLRGGGGVAHGAPSDAHVQGTNDDAQLSKMSCVKLGYFKDDFIHHFVKRPVRRAPLINRGYYSRYAALRGLLLSFLSLPPGPGEEPQHAASGAGAAGAAGQPVTASEEQQQQQPGPGCSLKAAEVDGARAPAPRRQVLSLGAGFDTTYFQLAREWRAPCRYYEVDYAEVTRRKAAVIQQAPDLLACLGAPEATSIDAEAGRVVSPAYVLLPADLRDTQGLAAALESAGFDPDLPTFVLCESVLVYLEPEESAAVVRWLGAQLRCAAMAIYEQIRPDDPFGQQMLRNLECRGCPLRGIRATPDLEAQRQRFTGGGAQAGMQAGAGWSRGEARSMDDVYRCCIEPGERRRIERLELFDEFEEWDLIQAHYCVALGIKDSTGLLDKFGFPQYAAALPPALQRRPVG